MKWHPPIPAGLATDPAIHELQYKTAVILLIYCYDGVRRDGRVIINLKEAAIGIQEPYETVRRWWRELRRGPFFCEQIDRGRIGWEVKFSDEWIDWHVLSNNFQRSPMNGKEPSIHSSINFERSSMNVDVPAYKVLIDSDQAESIGGGEDQDRTARTTPALALVTEYFPHETFSADETDDISSTVRDLAVWRTSLQIWRRNKWPFRLGNLLDRYDKELARANKGQPNDKLLRPSLNGHSERGVISETDLDKGF